MKKIIVKFTHVDTQILPRDIRNYIGSIVSEDYKELFMWHQNTTPAFLYQMPSKNSFALYTYRHDMSAAIEHLCGRLVMNPNIKLRGVTAHIESVFVRDGVEISLKDGLYRYKTLSPMIIAVNRKGIHSDIREVKSSTDVNIHNEYLSRIIGDCLANQIMDWHGVEFDISDLDIFIEDAHFFNYKYHDTSEKGFKYYDACHATFTSSKQLPEFVGYKIGLGFGSLKFLKNSEK